jgi:hypothetical protein
MMTGMGVRIGWQAFSRCCLKAVLAGLLDLCFFGWLGSSDLQQNIFLIVADMASLFEQKDYALETG